MEDSVRPTRAPFLLAVLAAATLALGGCTASADAAPPPTAPTPPTGLTERDAAALATLARVAPRTSTIDVSLAEWTECWLPSGHLIPADEVADATTWKVICRIFWHERDGTQRYQDTNCIGDFAKTPMLDHCYRWVHYDLEPAYRDHPGVFAGYPDD